MTTRRKLAKLGDQLGESDDELFTTTLRALASPQSGEIGSAKNIEFVAGQIYANADGTPEMATQYVKTFLEVFDISNLSDVNSLLGRESHERENYKGQLAFAQSSA